MFADLSNLIMGGDWEVPIKEEDLPKMDVLYYILINFSQGYEIFFVFFHKFLILLHTF